MDTTLIAAAFVIGYLAIALEHPLRISKSATALILGVVCWLLYALGSDMEATLPHLAEHLSDVSQIILFLIGAMTIVEIIDAHKGFSLITDIITTDSKRKLLWVVSFIAFFLSSVIDNMTATIIMISLGKKLLKDHKDRLIFASMIVISANAGGAWTPIGDVTTTMLWIGGQITTVNIMKILILPSLVCLVIPLLYQSLYIKGTFERPAVHDIGAPAPYSRLIFFLGIAALLFVPFFKAVTHLPPYLGMMFSVGLMWVVTDLLHHKYEDRMHMRVHKALSRIDVSSVLFFLGILLTVSALQTAGILTDTAAWLDTNVRNKDVIVTVLGLLSAVIDNVPLTAACQGMYSLTDFPVDHKIWETLAYAVGTGGSCLIIGSAAGVVAMGMEKIEFFWYVRKVTFTALIGYIAGILAYLGIYMLLH